MVTWFLPLTLVSQTELKALTCHKLWYEHEIGQTLSLPNLVWSSYRATVMLAMVKIIKPTKAVSPPSALFNDLVVWASEMRPGFRAQRLLRVSLCNNQLALVPLSSLCACCAANPSCPGARTEQSLLGLRWGRRMGVSWHCATFLWLPGLTGGKEGGCCVSDCWGQVCGLGIECCRTDVLLAHPAVSAARPPAPPYSPYRNS